MPTLTPRLVVRDAARAIDFYAHALAAKELRRDAHDGTIVNAELAIGDARFLLVEEQRAWHNHAPTSLGGTSVLLTLDVDDVDAVGERLAQAGAKVVFAIADHAYGKREGRFVDPFGHMWIVSQPLRAAARRK